MSEEAEEVLIGPSSFESFVAERDVFGIGSEHIGSEAANHGVVSLAAVLFLRPLI